jgi:hypothetical protein
MAILLIAMPSIKSVPVLFAIIGVYAIVDNLCLPIRFAIPLDLSNKDIGYWRAAEFYGNIGSLIAFSLSSLFLYLGNRWLPFALYALLAFSFPFLASKKTAAKTRYKLSGSTPTS